MQAILFDLDGTLVDSAPGIVSCVRETLSEYGGPRLDDEAVRAVIGPSLRTSLGHLLPEARLDEAVAFYRSLYATRGMFEAALYPGMEAVLAEARRAGLRSFVCTAKLTRFAHRIADHFAIAGEFEGIFGSEPDGRFEHKPDLVAHILAVHGLRPGAAVLVGDRREDMIAAKAHGLAGIGALWGYGGELELTSAGADALCAAPADLPGVIDALTTSPTPPAPGAA